MVKGFWATLPKPIFVLAPLAGVTDAAFRFIIAKYGKPDVMYTEFTSADGLCSRGRKAILIDLAYSEGERPIVAQLFGSNPENMEQACCLVRELGFDAIDINMGCPDKGIERQGAGAAHIKNPKLAQEIIAAAIRGAQHLPVSVKTRIGYSKNTLDEWLPYLLEMQLAAIVVHGRTRKEMSKVPAHWDAIGRAVELRDKYDSSDGHTLILGNGDVQDLDEARQKVAQHGVDGVMIGRGIFGNPWRFNTQKKIEDLPLQTRLGVMLEHSKLFEELYKKDLPDEKRKKPFDLMKKHFKAYVNGFEGAKELRVKLMETNNAQEVEEIVRGF
ncbi:MAG: tRNA-dihydrouridine synthase [bacterium]|nr:tRNA-dihydrouridine synthase [bacterium]